MLPNKSICPLDVAVGPPLITISRGNTFVLAELKIRRKKKQAIKKMYDHPHPLKLDYSNKGDLDIGRSGVFRVS